MNNSFENSEKGFDEVIMEWFSDHSATILVVATLATFIITGFFEFFFYKEAFITAMPGGFAVFTGVIVPLIIQGIRAATVVNSAKKFKQGQNGKGAFIMFLSLATTIFCSFEMNLLANYWEKGESQFSGAIGLVFQFLVFSGFAQEIILAISLSGKDRPTPAPKADDATTKAQAETAKAEAEAEAAKAATAKAQAEAKAAKAEAAKAQAEAEKQKKDWLREQEIAYQNGEKPMEINFTNGNGTH